MDEFVAMCDCEEVNAIRPIGWHKNIRVWCKRELTQEFAYGDVQPITEHCKNDFWGNFGDDVQCVGTIGEDLVFLPSVSWLLREIEVGDGLSWVELCKAMPTNIRGQRLGDVAQYHAEIHDDTEEYPTPRYQTPFCDSPDKALLHVFMWQKGKVWKEELIDVRPDGGLAYKEIIGEWRAK